MARQRKDQTPREFCEEQGWGIGQEIIGDGCTPVKITAIGETEVLAMGPIRETTVNFRHHDWKAAPYELTRLDKMRDLEKRMTDGDEIGAHVFKDVLKGAGLDMYRAYIGITVWAKDAHNALLPEYAASFDYDPARNDDGSQYWAEITDVQWTGNYSSNPATAWSVAIIRAVIAELDAVA